MDFEQKGLVMFVVCLKEITCCSSVKQTFHHHRHDMTLAITEALSP